MECICIPPTMAVAVPSRPQDTWRAISWPRDTLPSGTCWPLVPEPTELGYIGETNGTRAIEYSLDASDETNCLTKCAHLGGNPQPQGGGEVRRGGTAQRLNTLQRGGAAYSDCNGRECPCPWDPRISSNLHFSRNTSATPIYRDMKS